MHTWDIWKERFEENDNITEKLPSQISWSDKLFIKALGYVEGMSCGHLTPTPIFTLLFPSSNGNKGWRKTNTG